MKKHAFLMPQASLAAALATNQATANVLNVVVDPTVDAKIPFLSHLKASVSPLSVAISSLSFF